jgi:hypothetical protein
LRGSEDDGIGLTDCAICAGVDFSVSFSAVISVIAGSLSAIISVSGSNTPSEIKVCGVSPDRASISAIMAAFSGSASKPPDLGVPRPHGGTQRDTSDNAYSSDYLLFHVDQLLSPTHISQAGANSYRFGE